MLIKKGNPVIGNREFRLNYSLEIERKIREIKFRDKLLDAGMELAEHLLLKSPLGLRMTKKSLNLSLDRPSLETISEFENRAQVLSSMSKDIYEEMSTFAEKRKPNYPLR